MRRGDLLALAGLVALSLVLGLGSSYETDVFFRVRVGQEIVARHGLLATNTFSFTYPDFPDLDTAWLAEVGMALAHRVGGLAGVVVGKALLIAALAAASFSSARRGASCASSTLAVTLALALMRDRFVERPHMVSLLCGALWLWLLLRVAGAPSPPRSRSATLRALALAGSLLVVWANAHAGVFLAPALAGLAALGYLAARRSVGRSAGRSAGTPAPEASRLAAATLLGVIACFLQPHGFGIIRYWWLHVTLPRLHTVDEFRVATWRSDAPVLVALALGVASGLWLARRCVGWRPWWVAAAGVSFLSVFSVRFSADALLWWVPLWAAALDELVSAWGAKRPLVRNALGWAAPAVIAGLAFSTLLARSHRGETLLVPRIEAPVPAEALAFLAQHGLRERMYNDFETGSYLLYEGFPRHRVFVDPRLPAYPASFHALLGRFDHDRASWDRAMNDFGVQSALLVEAGLNRRVAWWEPKTWALVFRAQDARIFVRRVPAWQALIARFEIPLAWDFTVEEGAAPHLLTEQPASSPVAACEWQRRLGELAFELDDGKLDHAWPFYRAALAEPGCLAAADEAPLVSWLGAELLVERQPAEALLWLERAHLLLPQDLRVAANRAFALAGAGRREAALRAWEGVAAAAHGTPLEEKARAQAAALADPPR